MFIPSYAPAAPVAYVSQIHYTAHYQYAIAACIEIPHPDDDVGSLSAKSVTGHNEFSPVQQIDFTVQVLMPLCTPQPMPDFNCGVRVQTSALGQAHRPASKMRGRK